MLDVSENNKLDDQKAIEFARKSTSRHKITVDVYVLKHDGDIVAI